MSEKRDDLKTTEELFAFLQGNVPATIHIECKDVPKLSADQAWSVIWYLGELHWKVPDYIERCDVCDTLYDSNREGACLDYGAAPYHFCEGCIWSTEYQDKRKAAREEA